VAIWVWLFFEDIDAPATAAMLIFVAFAFIERVVAKPRPAPTLITIPLPHLVDYSRRS
jgi:hypothetical protein